MFVFSSKPGIWTSFGFRDLKNIIKRAKTHSESKDHIKATFDFASYKNGMNLLSKKYKLTISENEALKQQKRHENCFYTFLDILLTLVMQGVALRGKDESFNSGNKGNLIEISQLLSRYDEDFKDSLNQNILNISDPKIQNKTLRIVYEEVINYLIDEIKGIEFLNIIIDEGTDVNNVKQMGVVFRFVKDSEITERFIGFFSLGKKQTSEDLFKIVKISIKSYAKRMMEQQ